MAYFCWCCKQLYLKGGKSKADVVRKIHKEFPFPVDIGPDRMVIAMHNALETVKKNKDAKAWENACT